MMAAAPTEKQLVLLVASFCRHAATLLTQYFERPVTADDLEAIPDPRIAGRGAVVFVTSRGPGPVAGYTLRVGDVESIAEVTFPCWPPRLRTL